MRRFFVLLFLNFSAYLLSQNVSGVVTDEDENALTAVMVFNMRTGEKAYTDTGGKFSIKATADTELRFVRKGFERNFRVVNQSDFNNVFNVVLTRRPEEIEEVEISHIPTGVLDQDLKNVGDKKPTAKLKGETAKYIRSDSAPEVLAAKPGEFVQPVGSGFFVGNIDNQWDDVDFMNFLVANIHPSFFLEDLKLTPSEIQPFIYYIFRNFDRKEILFRGYSTSYDLSRFMRECYQKIEAYRKNLPNEPSKKKSRK